MLRVENATTVINILSRLFIPLSDIPTMLHFDIKSGVNNFDVVIGQVNLQTYYNLATEDRKMQGICLVQTLIGIGNIDCHL